VGEREIVKADDDDGSGDVADDRGRDIDDDVDDDDDEAETGTPRPLARQEKRSCQSIDRKKVTRPF
jgi:hypothetical protein